MTSPLPIAKSSHELCLLPGLANRHGLTTRATGTGKAVPLQTMAEAFSSMGVPVFMADVKGDLAGLSQAGSMNPRLKGRVDKLVPGDFAFAGCPTVFWDVYGALGHPVRATVSEMGPLLLARLLDLNDTQNGVLTLGCQTARERRSGKTEADSLLRRSARAVQRCAAGAAGQDRTGGTVDPIQGRRRLFRDTKSARRAGRGARTTGKPRAACAARLYPARPEGGENRGNNATCESRSRRREGHYRTGCRRSAGVVSRREGPPDHGRTRVRAATPQPHRSDHDGRAYGVDQALAGGRQLRSTGRSRIVLRSAQGPPRAQCNAGSHAPYAQTGPGRRDRLCVRRCAGQRIWRRKFAPSIGR